MDDRLIGELYRNLIVKMGEKMKNLAIAFSAASFFYTATAQAGTFFRERGDPSVYYVFDENSYCGVPSPVQMNLWGGFDRVVIVTKEVADGYKNSRTYSGHCAWPNGNFRVDGTQPVYHIEGSTICTIDSPEKLISDYGGWGSVIVVEVGNNLFSHKRDTGVCPWRS